MDERIAAVDDYIARASAFAQPILSHLRELVHRGCPEVAEAIKWGHPHFLHEGMLCGMAGFKQHCAFGFWKGAMVVDQRDAGPENAMGQFGRIESLSDLPKDSVLIAYVQRAAELNRRGTKPLRPKKPAPKRELTIPEDFMAALRRNRPALATFEGFSYTNRKDYLDWLEETKREAIRQRRLETAVEWLAEGKVRNWKYVR